MIANKIPPQVLEIEEAVLSAILLNGKVLDKIALCPDDFYSTAHQQIFKGLINLKSSQKPIDILTVVEELQCMKSLDKAGGIEKIVDISDKVSSAAHIEYHAAIIKQKSIARQLINQSNEVLRKAFDESVDVQDTMEYIEKNITEFKSGNYVVDYMTAKESISKTLEYLIGVQERKNRGESVAIPTGLNELDRIFNGGWTAPDLIILGGRPGMGKTQFALHFAKAAANSNKHCLFISIEMIAEQLIMRILTEDERVNLHDMKSGQLSEESWKAIDETVSQFENSSLYIADDHNIRSLRNIKSLARKLSRQNKLDLLVIDYLQLIKTEQAFGTRDLEIGHITGELKNLAKELSIPVILLAQLSRPPKGVKVQIPVLSDLRESGNIEQDADKVIFPHRPSYYDQQAVDSNCNSWENRGVLIIGKNREGMKDERVYFKTDNRFKKIWDENNQYEGTPF